MSIWKQLSDAVSNLAHSGERIGAFAGGLAQHFGLHWGKDGARQTDIEFTIGVIALGAKMAKADGRVTVDEIKAFREVFKVPEDDQENVARIFNLAKRDVAGYETYASKLAAHFERDPELLEHVLEGLFHIASADGVLHPSEEAYLENVAGAFGFDESCFRSIRARFVEDEERDPYEVLGVDRSIDDATLKTHYRKLVVENHPDRALARGLPAEFVDIATEKLAAINDAYARIKQERGI